MGGLRLSIIISTMFLFCFFDNTEAKQGHDFNGAEKDLIIYIFLAPDCPISLKYINTLREMDSIFHKEVAFIGLFPKTYSTNQMEEFRKEYNINFDILIDDNNNFINKFNISVTPEVLLIKNDKVLYQGAINNWFYALGKNRAKPTEHYLIDAISLTLANEKVEVAKTEAIGCIISK
ncbi:redoxin domain-containing protein [Fulvivirga lutimaris]|uniref:redoxin domain-containing protein n=1 Tax=Fulvivirga lutimaris TaxID=1819566 RepID=UPI0012BCEA31|nr:redoxin domain-containing protein [Fulvivirga lutimaris]MTI38517.1 redoxin domain-containing protein [Fulvivirga lutimaris]